ncbi:MAG: nucleotide sugar dehydrogenase [Anaerolineae bacterium]
MRLQDRIRNQSATVAVVGLGYVGLPLAAAFGEVGYRVIGVDVDEAKVAAIQRGESYIGDVASERIAGLLAAGRLTGTTDYHVLPDADVIFVCVPTPFDRMKTPDLSYVRAASDGIAGQLRVGQLIILQSTTYPGTTEEEILPILERSGLRAGIDFHLAFSPERVNPGDTEHTVFNTPKVVGGFTPRCAQLAANLLATLNPEVHVVSTPRVAEMTKLLENIFRSVNIALVNEMALLSERMGIDIWEVIEAASTKTFGFMPFRPGPGVGGHCIPVDPFYLSWKAREYDFSTRFVELAADVNQAMPHHVVETISRTLNAYGIPVSDASILILGVAFKPDVDDPRNSPAERIIELLLDRGAQVAYHDPHVPSFRVGDDVFHRDTAVLESISLTDVALAQYDCAVIVAGHRWYDYAWIVRQARLIIDTVNATAGVPDPDGKVIRLGASGSLRSRPQTGQSEHGSRGARELLVTR